MTNIDDAMTRHLILSILMAVAGVFLLLPGVCAAGFIVLGGLRNPDLFDCEPLAGLLSDRGGWSLVAEQGLQQAARYQHITALSHAAVVPLMFN